MKNIKMLLLFVVFVGLLIANAVVMVDQSTTHTTIVTEQGCCTVDITYEPDTGVYTLQYNDYITDNSSTVVEYNLADAEWTIAEMTTDYCYAHDY